MMPDEQPDAAQIPESEGISEHLLPESEALSLARQRWQEVRQHMKWNDLQGDRNNIPRQIAFDPEGAFRAVLKADPKEQFSLLLQLAKEFVEARRCDKHRVHPFAARAFAHIESALVQHASAEFLYAKDSTPEMSHQIADAMEAYALTNLPEAVKELRRMRSLPTGINASHLQDLAEGGLRAVTRIDPDIFRNLATLDPSYADRLLKETMDNFPHAISSFPEDLAYRAISLHLKTPPKRGIEHAGDLMQTVRDNYLSIRKGSGAFGVLAALRDASEGKLPEDVLKLVIQDLTDPWRLRGESHNRKTLPRTVAERLLAWPEVFTGLAATPQGQALMLKPSDITDETIFRRTTERFADSLQKKYPAQYATLVSALPSYSRKDRELLANSIDEYPSEQLVVGARDLHQIQKYLSSETDETKRTNYAERTLRNYPNPLMAGILLPHLTLGCLLRAVPDTFDTQQPIPEAWQCLIREKAEVLGQFRIRGTLDALNDRSDIMAALCSLHLFPGSQVRYRPWVRTVGRKYLPEHPALQELLDTHLMDPSQKAGEVWQNPASFEDDVQKLQIWLEAVYHVNPTVARTVADKIWSSSQSHTAKRASDILPHLQRIFYKGAFDEQSTVRLTPGSVAQALRLLFQPNAVNAAEHPWVKMKGKDPDHRALRDIACSILPAPGILAEDGTVAEKLQKKGISIESLTAVVQRLEQRRSIGTRIRDALPFLSAQETRLLSFGHALLQACEGETLLRTFVAGQPLALIAQATLQPPAPVHRTLADHLAKPLAENLRPLKSTYISVSDEQAILTALQNIIDREAPQEKLGFIALRRLQVRRNMKKILGAAVVLAAVGVGTVFHKSILDSILPKGKRTVSHEGIPLRSREDPLLPAAEAPGWRKPEVVMELSELPEGQNAYFLTNIFASSNTAEQKPLHQINKEAVLFVERILSYEENVEQYNREKLRIILRHHDREAVIPRAIGMEFSQFDTEPKSRLTRPFFLRSAHTERTNTHVSATVPLKHKEPDPTLTIEGFQEKLRNHEEATKIDYSILYKPRLTPQLFRKLAPDIWKAVEEARKLPVTAAVEHVRVAVQQSMEYASEGAYLQNAAGSAESHFQIMQEKRRGMCVQYALIQDEALKQLGIPCAIVSCYHAKSQTVTENNAHATNIVIVPDERLVFIGYISDATGAAGQPAVLPQKKEEAIPHPSPESKEPPVGSKGMAPDSEKVTSSEYHGPHGLQQPLGGVPLLVIALMGGWHAYLKNKDRKRGQKKESAGAGENEQKPMGTEHTDSNVSSSSGRAPLSRTLIQRLLGRWTRGAPPSETLPQDNSLDLISPELIQRAIALQMEAGSVEGDEWTNEEHFLRMLEGMCGILTANWTEAQQIVAENVEQGSPILQERCALNFAFWKWTMENDASAWESWRKYLQENLIPQTEEAEKEEEMDPMPKRLKKEEVWAFLDSASKHLAEPVRGQAIAFATEMRQITGRAATNQQLSVNGSLGCVRFFEERSS